jgi:hypothetical protein
MSTRTLAFLASFALGVAASAQSTAFTYQGRLKNGAVPAAGVHDFRFTLFNAASGGAQVGAPQCVDNLTVTEGLFNATIDFGPQFATTEARFLQIEVRADTGLNCANPSGFVALGPRQPVNPAPAASHANAAFTLDAPDGSPANAVFVDNDGKVGIGTTTPAMPLDIRHEEPVAILHDSGPASTQSGYLGFWNSNNAETAWVGFGTPGSPHFSLVNSRANGDVALFAGSGGALRLLTQGLERLFVNSAGNVGVGTTSPAAKLDVRGSIRLGGTGELMAPGGTENLRLLRGNIDGNGTIDAGSGFTCQRLNEGIYRITFSTPFSGVPTVTATAVWPFLDPLRTAVIDSVSSSQVTIETVFQDVVGPGTTDSDWSFCVIGPR